MFADACAEDWTVLGGVQGAATLIDRGRSFRNARALPDAKYPQYSETAAIEGSRDTTVDVTPTRVPAWPIDA